ncbi:OsmC family protein [Streptomyces sp. NPDC002537]
MSESHPTLEQADAASEARRVPGDGLVVVTENGVGTYGQHIQAGPHVLVADEPEPAGADSGPNPYDLLLAALGTCTSMTVRMYAERKGWPLEQVTVSLRHQRVHVDDCAEDCADGETGRGGLIDRITREIRLDGDLDADQRKRLMDIAERCPVHRTLTSRTLIATTESAQG